MLAITDESINPTDRSVPPITYSCYSAQVRAGEEFIADHILSYQLSGRLLINDGLHTHVLEAGAFRLTRRNSVFKFVKQPLLSHPYQNISIRLSQDLLRACSLEHGYSGHQKSSMESVIPVLTTPLLRGYIDSLKPYEALDWAGHQTLLVLKLREAVAVLLNAVPTLSDVLFDFSEPGKIDLEAFMHQHYRFNLSLDRFAYLSGRSLSTFKRDFAQCFHTRPSHWLVQKRLEWAYERIIQAGVSVSAVYLEAGFENLSHFSFAFKKRYGYAPTKL